MKKSKVANSLTQSLSLRRYQVDAVTAAMQSLNYVGSKNLVVMPTGSGKSVVISEIIKNLKDQQILVITPRRRLLKQIRPLLGVHGVLSGTLGTDLGDKHDKIAGTFQTMTRRKGMKTPDVIFIDECHLLPPHSKFSELLNRYPRAVVLGFTATPYRGKLPLTNLGLEWKEIFSVSMPELIKNGFLVPPISKGTGNIHLSENMGICSTDEVTRVIVPVLTHTAKKDKRKKCVVFCINIDHAKLTQQLLQKAGEHCVYLIHSGLSQQTQDQQFNSFQNSSHRAWLVNVGIVSIGVDIPCIDCVAILRDISSFALLVQIIGRGLRLFGDKKECFIYDFGRGTHRFGFIDDPVFRVSHSKGQLLSLKPCPTCNRLHHFATSTCRDCGQKFPMSTSLRDHASETQLLSTEYIKATYKNCEINTSKGDKNRLMHQLTHNFKTLIAFEDMDRIRITKQRKFVSGDLVLVKHLGGSVVKILSY